MIDQTDPGVDPSPLQEAVLSLLEDAGMPPASYDKIMALIDEWESEKYAEESESAYLRSQEGPRP